ncbi:hypothetical protein [Solirubrum puertoriconensis]|uniref:Secreted protein n=1 Tax=Solirubrum puertoriconensis TaxID=1751427 RepID=A0A9X0HJC9_SOLP1|nr:hypothetical protein [Solirubrum puertoriconensis]KUG06945.1 hypothetical protein ASU33_06370 [Solirubrum puertoriconensis]
MKTLFAAPVLGLLMLVAPRAHAQAAWPDRTRALPAKLRQVPVGLTLWHTPNPVYPEPNPEKPGQYVWKHSTSVRADVADLEIVECGSFIWYNESGWQANMRETPAEFAELFGCPQGKLLKGQTYTYERNYRYATSRQQLYGGDALWYILARDKNGRLFKGMGLIETEQQLQGDNTSTR